MTSVLKVDSIQNAGGTAAMTIDSSGNIKPTASGSVVAVRHYSNSTRSIVYSAATGTLWTLTDTKLYGVESAIIIHANIIGLGDNSGVVSTFIEYGGTKSYSIQYTYEANDFCKLLTGTSKTTGKDAGSQTLNIGWDAANGSASESPFIRINPNATEDVRLHQTVSTIIVYEVIA